MNDEATLYLDYDGKEVEATVLFTCNLEETGKDYVVFIAPNPETGAKEVSAARYEETDDENGSMSPVETDEEWDILEEYLDDFIEEKGLDLDELLK